MRMKQNPLQNQKQRNQNQSEILIQEELDRVYITRDGKKHLSYKDALKHLDILSRIKI